MKPKATPKFAVDAAIQALSAESDRGAATLAGSLVENALGQFLEAHCRPNLSKKDMESLFGVSGPVSSFAQRALVSKAFGLIEDADFEQLNLIRHIRNHFAHHPLQASFDDEEIQKHIQKLRFRTVVTTHAELQTAGIARMSYLLTCSFLLGTLVDDPTDLSLSSSQ